MLTNELKTALKKAESELVSAGWRKGCSVMHDGAGVSYGVCFSKDGVKFYLNKGTCMPAFTGPEMATICKPLFND
jgi:hypothetical protein